MIDKFVLKKLFSQSQTFQTDFCKNSAALEASQDPRTATMSLQHPSFLRDLSRHTLRFYICPDVSLVFIETRSCRHFRVMFSCLKNTVCSEAQILILWTDIGIDGSLPRLELQFSRQIPLAGLFCNTVIQGYSRLHSTTHFCAKEHCCTLGKNMIYYIFQLF